MPAGSIRGKGGTDGRAGHGGDPGSAALLGVTVALALAALLAPLLAPHPPDLTDLAAQLQAPSAAHLLGTDFFGRDVLSRILFGGRSTLLVAGAAVTLAAIIGSVAGLLAGWSEGWAGQFWVGVFDLMLAFPALLAGAADRRGARPGIACPGGGRRNRRHPGVRAAGPRAHADAA